MTDAIAVVGKLTMLGIKVTVVGNKLLLEPGSRVPPELVEELRQHKAEIIEVINSPGLFESPPLWHAETIAAVVEREGICIFWSQLFAEMVAFIKDDSFKGHAPCGVVEYTVKELRALFGSKTKPLSDHSLCLLHEAKRRGARIVGREPEPN
jgi:hypothetical protein